tara:strand:- start:668 stop:1057 length:390 start_codon:yes stop_codon:yes gene_type:complete
MLYDHFNDCPKTIEAWPVHFFKPYEIACRGTGQLFVNRDALLKIEMLRLRMNKPMTINSSFRSMLHNAKIGGAPFSCHSIRGGASAFDVSLNGFDKSELIKCAKGVGFTGFGVNYKTFLHIDCGRARSW